jgi:hypothetical protein
MIPVYVINLTCDVARRARIEAQLATLPELVPSFLTAVDGGALPEQVCAALSDKSWAKNKGTIGCFLSHVRAWELLAKLTIPYAVVLEDDAEFIGVQTFSSLNLPSDFDIVFINERMSRNVKGEGFVGMAESLRTVEFARDGFGTDGYILTPLAATKLLKACVENFYSGHVDGRLVRYATSPEELDKLGEAPVAEIIRRHHDQSRLPQLGLLKGYVLTKPFVRQNVSGPSSRARADVRNVESSTVSHPASVHRYDFANMADPPEAERVLKVLEVPKSIPRKLPEFVADFSGRGLELKVSGQQEIHGSYLVRRENVLLFGPNNLVGPEGHWSCEARTFKRQFLWYFHQPFYDHIFPGPKPAIDYKTENLLLRTDCLKETDVERIDIPVFLATPLEPPIWGRWIVTVAQKVMQYKEYGAGRKFLCHAVHDWQRAFLRLLGVEEGMILAHDPGRTYVCRDLMTVEYSVTNMTVSAMERANLFSMIANYRVRIERKRKIFVSRLSRSRQNPNYRVLQNEVELASMLEELGFTTIEPETLPFEEQISIFAGAEQVVFLGGSGVFNAAFCAPGTSVVTIESSDTYIGHHTELLASLDMRYGVIFGKEDPEDQSDSHKRWTIDVACVRDELMKFFGAD